MRLGTAKVTYEALEAALRLPKGVHIVGAHVEGWNVYQDNSICLRLSGPDLLEVPEGCRIPYVTLVITNGEARIVQ